MIDQMPTPEEFVTVKLLIKENKNDASKLDKAEKYVYEMSKVFVDVNFQIIPIVINLQIMYRFPYCFSGLSLCKF